MKRTNVASKEEIVNKLKETGSSCFDCASDIADLTFTLTKKAFFAIKDAITKKFSSITQ